MFARASPGQPRDIVELDGVATPLPLLVPEADPQAQAPAGVTYGYAALPLAAPDAAGWSTMVGLVQRLSAGHQELLPHSIQMDGDWRPFAPTPVPPDWWPMQQTLATDTLSWELAPAGFPGESLTEVSLHGELDLATIPDVLEALVGLRTAYAMVHHWTPAEPVAPVVGLRRDGPDGPPWLFITGRDLAVGLPGIYWAQVVGPEWEHRIGRDRLAAGRRTGSKRSNRTSG